MWQPAHHALTRKQRRLRTLSRKSWGAWALLAGLLLVIWGGAAGIVWWMTRKASASDHLPAVTLEPEQDLVYDLWKLEPGQSRFFTYPSRSSERSRLLVNRDSDGVIRAAFATCTTCYSFRKQHYLKDGQFICGRCQTAMAIGGRNERMTPDKGCVAVPVPFSIEHNRVIVRAQAITEGAKELVEAAAKVASRADASSKPLVEDP
jgi:uncharacterized membrane protein